MKKKVETVGALAKSLCNLKPSSANFRAKIYENYAQGCRERGVDQPALLTAQLERPCGPYNLRRRSDKVP